MWAAEKHNESILHLARAAALASTSNPARAKLLSDAAISLTSFIDAGDDPRSIPISLDFDAESVHSAMIEIVAPQKPSAPPPRVRKGTLPEDFRPAPDTVRVDIAPIRPLLPRVDLTATVPQGQKPIDPEELVAPTRRVEVSDTKRDPDFRKKT